MWLHTTAGATPLVGMTDSAWAARLTSSSRLVPVTESGGELVVDKDRLEMRNSCGVFEVEGERVG